MAVVVLVAPPGVGRERRRVAVGSLRMLLELAAVVVLEVSV